MTGLSLNGLGVAEGGWTRRRGERLHLTNLSDKDRVHNLVYSRKRRRGSG